MACLRQDSSASQDSPEEAPKSSNDDELNKLEGGVVDLGKGKRKRFQNVRMLPIEEVCRSPPRNKKWIKKISETANSSPTTSFIKIMFFIFDKSSHFWILYESKWEIWSINQKLVLITLYTTYKLISWQKIIENC